MKGTLFFVKSKNPPVFGDVIDINYSEPPKVGEPFFFSAGHLSVVQRLVKMEDCLLIKTLNSTYMLYMRES